MCRLKYCLLNKKRVGFNSASNQLIFPSLQRKFIFHEAFINIVILPAVIIAGSKYATGGRRRLS